MKVINVPQLPWHGRKDLALFFPNEWDVEVCNMAGHYRAPITKDDIQKSLQNPLGTLPLTEIARGKKEGVIIFDDLSRGTRAYEIIPFVLAELAAAGISDSKIRFIAALGLHGTMNRTDFAKKLGENVVRRFGVYNHNPFGNCIYVGKTRTFGTDIYANAEVMQCDLKIGIGSTVPHPLAGFGGGSKLIHPGIVSSEAIAQNHQKSIEAAVQSMKASQRQKHSLNIGMARYWKNPVPKDSDEAAEMVGLQFLINVLLNTKGESVSIFAGGFKEVHHAAVKEAERHYLTPLAREKDIVIANTFTKHNESAIGLVSVLPSLNPSGGDVVLISNTPDGQIPHYLCGTWGNKTFAKQYVQVPLPSYLNRLINYNEYPNPGSRWFEPSEKVLFKHRWEDVLDLLNTTHGNKTKVAVYPGADIQYTA